MLCDTTIGNLRVPQGYAAENDHQFRVGADLVPGRLFQFNLRPGCNYVGQNHLCRSCAVAIHGSGAAPRHIDESMKLGLGVIESAGACPTVGTAKDRRVAIFVCDPFDFPSGEL